MQGGSTFESEGKILKCDHSNDSFGKEIPSCVDVYYAVQGGSYF